MIKNKLSFLLLISLLTHNSLVAQDIAAKNYVILTIEDSFSKSFEGVKKYYWIIEADSIKSSSRGFFPLLLSGFSKANFQDCCKGIDIDPFVLTPTDSVFDIGTGYFEKLENLEKLIFLQRKKVQQIVKEWVLKKNKEVITFYITPITGRFCNSGFAKTGQWRTGYTGKIFIPFSSFDVNLNFWDSIQLSILTNIDFGNLKFNSVK